MKIDGKFFTISTILFAASSAIYMYNNIALNTINLVAIIVICTIINKKLISKTSKRIIGKITNKAS